ncbi:MAG TPA: amino acid ABC transporter permease [Alphaproteobacteria bacterium]|nr:amino acid ABC transporter permease [Alphaproteobacteria bacterium]
MSIAGATPRGTAWLRLDPVSLASFVGGIAVIYGIYAAIDWKFVRALDFHVLVDYWHPLLNGALTTLAITAAALMIGLAVGVLLAVLLQLPVGPLRWLIVAYVELWRNTPLIVQLFWVHFGLPVLTGISTTAFESGFLALSMQSSAYLADIARAGIQAVPKGQWQAGHALGLPTASLWLEVVLPQALKIMVPAFANLALSFLNGSALLGLIQVGELMTVATKISDYTFKPIEVMTAVGVLYLLINLAIGRLAHWLEIATRIPR